MKRRTGTLLMALLMALMMTMMFAACASDDTADDSEGQEASSGPEFDVSLADYKFSDDGSKLTVTLAFDNHTNDAIVPKDVIAVKAVQDGEELTFPDESLDGPALGDTETQYELDYDVNSDSPVKITVSSLDDGTEIVSQEIGKNE